jgi:hypothetical protein
MFAAAAPVAMLNAAKSLSISPLKTTIESFFRFSSAILVAPLFLFAAQRKSDCFMFSLPFSESLEIFSVCPESEKEKAADGEKTYEGLHTASLLEFALSCQAYSNG